MNLSKKGSASKTFFGRFGTSSCQNPFSFVACGKYVIKKI
jgi:hypothetical protein